MRKRKKNKPLLEPADLTRIKLSVTKLFRRSSEKSPLFIGHLAQSLLGDQQSFSLEVIDKLLNEVKQEFLNRKRTVGRKPFLIDGKRETGMYLTKRMSKATKVAVTETNPKPVILIIEKPEPKIKPKKGKRNYNGWTQIAYPITQSPDSQADYINVIIQNTEEKREEGVRKHDPEIDNHLNVILTQLGVSNTSKKLTFFVNQLTRLLGINPETLKKWEDDNKIIRRTGTKNDRRHPTFDLIEAIWIGYVNGNHLKGGITNGMPKDFRFYIEKYLKLKNLAISSLIK